MLPVARKKSNERCFPAKSSYKSWLAGFAKRRWSYGRLCRGWESATAMAQLNGAAVAVTGKAEETNGEKRRRCRPYSAAQKQEEATQEPSPCQCEAERGHDGDWNAIEARHRLGVARGYCSPKL